MTPSVAAPGDTNPSDATDDWCAAPWSHHADSALVARATTSPIQGRSLSWSSSVCSAMHQCIRWTTVSSSPTSAGVDCAPPTQRCVLFNVHTTPSAIGVLQLLDHACGTRCPPNYDNATVSESSNGHWKRTFGDHLALWRLS